MMEFIMLVFGVMVGTVLASVAMVVLLMNPVVMKWYMNRVFKLTMNVYDDMANVFETKEEEL